MELKDVLDERIIDLNMEAKIRMKQFVIWLPN